MAEQWTRNKSILFLKSHLINHLLNGISSILDWLILFISIAGAAQLIFKEWPSGFFQEDMRMSVESEAVCCTENPCWLSCSNTTTFFNFIFWQAQIGYSVYWCLKNCGFVKGSTLLEVIFVVTDTNIHDNWTITQNSHLVHIIIKALAPPLSLVVCIVVVNII